MVTSKPLMCEYDRGSRRPGRSTHQAAGVHHTPTQQSYCRNGESDEATITGRAGNRTRLTGRYGGTITTLCPSTLHWNRGHDE